MVQLKANISKPFNVNTVRNLVNKTVKLSDNKFRAESINKVKHVQISPTKS